MSLLPPLFIFSHNILHWLRFNATFVIYVIILGRCIQNFASVPLATDNICYKSSDLILRWFKD